MPNNGPLSSFKPGGDVRQLQKLLGQAGFKIAQGEIDGETLGPETLSALLKLKKKHKLPPTHVLDLAAVEELVGAAVPAGAAKHRVHGLALHPEGTPAEGVRVRLFHVAFGGGAPKEIGNAVVTNDQGVYVIEYDSPGGSLNLELRAITAGADGKETATPLSRTRFNAGASEEINVVVPAAVKAAPAEYQRLVGDVKKQLGGDRSLSEAKENGSRQDLALLHEATGWDARLLALAATAENAAKTTRVPAPALYAAFRAGLPTDPRQLAKHSWSDVEKAIREVAAEKIVDLDAKTVDEAKKAFDVFARTSRAEARGAGAVSTAGQLIDVADVTAAQKNLFRDIVLDHRGTSAELWKKLDDAKIPTAGLRVQGKLARLTQNNAELVARVHKKIGNDAAALVRDGFHKPAAWRGELVAIAGGEAQAERLIPPTYTGGTIQERLDAYASDLARNVRLSFPTEVLASKLKSKELKVKDDAVSESVAQFLADAGKKGFELGRMPLDAFLAKHRNDFETVAPATRDGVRLLQRLYQITPNDAALEKTLSLGIRSAYDVTALGFDAFMDRYGHRYTTSQEAELVYRRAQQVVAVAYNVLGAARQIGTANTVRAMSPQTAAQTDAVRGRIKDAFPNLEQLFGSMDFCSCDHCSSVLSPAAYFVDLLKFLDPDDDVWSHYTAEWARTHGKPYPFVKPFQALSARRPDLQHLPLTCANTNTAMPYIDLVNEILEYFIARNGVLDAGVARETGDATTTELLAEPQHLEPGAYDALARARYPVGLPFDLGIETVRRFFAHHEVRFADVLETFRRTDELFAAPTTDVPYARESVFAEQLRLSPDELAVFTTPAAASWFELYGFTSANDARAALLSAQTLARRLGVSYVDLAAIIATPFVNPNLEKLVALRKIGIAPETVFRAKQQNGFAPLTQSERAAYDAQLDAARTADFDPRAWIDATFTAGGFRDVIVLRETGSPCDFEKTHVVHAGGPSTEALSPLELHKLNLFVRLWRKLGWSIGETDAALRAFLPRALPITDFPALATALRSALIGIAHLATLEERLAPGRNGRRKLLTFWGDVPAAGKDSLYASLFLTRAVLKNDPVFDHPRGEYLTANRDLRDHLLTLQGALGVTAEEIGAIVDLDTAKLTLPNVSRIYRHAILARALRMSVRELIALRELSGTDPFAPLHPSAVQSLVEDVPFSKTIAFVELAEVVRGSGLSIDDVSWILRHHADPLGKHRPNPAERRAFLRELAREIARIRGEHAAPADPALLTDEVIRREIALVLPPDVAAGFMAMWAGTIQHEAVASGVEEDDRIGEAKLAGETALRVRYEPKWKRQTVTFTGVLHQPEIDRLTALAPSAVLASLLGELKAKSREPFDLRLDASRPGGFLAASDFELLFTTPPAPADADPETLRKREQKDRERRAKLAAALMPHVQRTLIRRAVVERAAARTELDAAIAEDLLTSPDLVQHGGEPLVQSLLACADAGVRRVRHGTDRETFDAWIEVPAAGAYRVSVSLEKKDATAELRFDHLAASIRGTAPNDGASILGTFELEGGVGYHLTVEGTTLGGGEMAIDIEGPGLPPTAIDRLSVPPAASMERAEHADVVLAKAAALIRALELAPREVRALFAKPGAVFDLDRLSSTSAAGSVANGNTAAFARLAEYARLRREMAGGSDALLDVFTMAVRGNVAPADVAAARAQIVDALASRIAEITRRDARTVRAVFDALRIDAAQAGNGVAVAALTNEKALRRVWEALRIANAIGVGPQDIAAATGAASTLTPFLARLDLSRRLRNALKARYDDEQWQRAGRAIFDPLRRKQRDALVAYLLHHQQLDRAEQLFEQLLIDPGMEPVVQTSRIRLALSSIQLFVQRVLMNLERDVEPAAIDAAEWEWMKRYRVWEANRKIFLYPENWLEPEFRDDKTHLCKELEDALLSGDVTNDLAEDALFRYLRGLDEIARLEIVTMWVEEKPLDPDARRFHVVGRTWGTPHKYFYRTYAHGAWTPWQPVTADIEGDHVVVVRWRDRICLFWLTFVEHTKTGEPDEKDTFEGIAKQKPGRYQGRQLEIHLHWSELLQGEWSARRSAPSPRRIAIDGAKPLDYRSIFVYATVDAVDGEERGVRIRLVGSHVLQDIVLDGRNADPRAELDVNAAPETPFHLQLGEHPTHFIPRKRDGVKDNTLTVDVKDDTSTDPARTILGNSRAGLLREAGFSVLLWNARSINLLDPVIARLVMPFFYQDEAHTFFVTATFAEERVLILDEGWILRDSIRDLPRLPVRPLVPKPDIPRPRDPFGGDPMPDSLIDVIRKPDWVSDPRTLLEFDDFVITHDGGFDPKAAGLRHVKGDRLTRDTLLVEGLQPLEVKVVGRGGGGLFDASDFTPDFEMPDFGRDFVKGLTR